MQKIFCYVDETGQDTKGEFFIAAVVITEQRHELEKVIEKIETDSGKRKTKWQKTKKELKKEFISQIKQLTKLNLNISYTIHKQSKSFKEATVITIAAAINRHYTEEYKATIFIDGLHKTEVKFISNILHKIGIKTEKVRGIEDESNAIIRLADAIVGCIRENYEVPSQFKEEINKIKERKILFLV